MTRDEVEKYLRIRSTEIGDCWIWRLTTTSKGHPLASIAGKRGVNVRRWAWQLLAGKSAGSGVIGTICGNAKCVCPLHLRLMTRKQNAKAAYERGGRRVTLRQRVARAEVGRRKSPLSWEDVQAIRQRRAQGQKLNSIAEQYGLSRAAVDRICRHVAWRDYGNPFLQLIA